MTCALTVVTHHGKPMAVLVSPEDYLELMRMKQAACERREHKTNALAVDAMP